MFKLKLTPDNFFPDSMTYYNDENQFYLQLKSFNYDEKQFNDDLLTC